MKATGIVRRIDDLGRVVIPKEIRRTMRIREGDPLEIYTDRDGEVIFKKYSPVGEMLSEAQGYCETLYKSCGIVVAVCDRDGVIACAGAPKKQVLEQKVPAEAEQIMDSRQLYCYTPGEEAIALGGSWHVSSMMPILSEGDVIGGVMCLKETPIEVGETEKALIRTAGIFLGRQLEE
ncbi:MAG: AbrB/MazE/SpoVT family DNA-binding domain-containing protein [Ruminococcaceae bacterium]|nr:AbrB/MazE/SpoVT family DNA-binding domain-containing protein [Oscillospiraceae bacterium]